MRFAIASLAALTFPALLTLSTVSADILHDNGTFITNPTGGTGAITGLPISQSDPFTVPGQTFIFSTTGVAATVATTTAAAEDFTVPAGVAWTLDSVTLYAFQTSQTTATITAVHVNLWTAPPFSAGSPIPLPDPLPQPLLASAITIPIATGTFVAHRESTSSTNTVRPVFAYTVPLAGLMSAIGHPLQAGTYWLEWSFEGALAPSANVFMPLVTPRTQTTNHNARLFNALNSADTRDWFEGREGFVAGVTEGRAYELPFILSGTTTPITPPCAADFNGTGGITVQDIFDFLAAWFAGNPQADFNHQNGIGVQDIFDFLSAWFAGCP